jgi:hypothetical protein
MAKRVPSSDIESIVGRPRHATLHLALADSSEETVHIMHSQECLATGIDLLYCPYTEALVENGIDTEGAWAAMEDRPVALRIVHGELVPERLVDE